VLGFDSESANGFSVLAPFAKVWSNHGIRPLYAVGFTEADVTLSLHSQNRSSHYDLGLGMLTSNDYLSEFPVGVCIFGQRVVTQDRGRLWLTPKAFDDG
jgi:hypothetical protein